MKIKVQDEATSAVLKDFIDSTSSLACAVVNEKNDIISVMGRWDEIEKVDLQEGVRRENSFMGNKVAHSAPIDGKRKLVVVFEGRERLGVVSLRAQRTIEQIWILSRE